MEGRGDQIKNFKGNYTPKKYLEKNKMEIIMPKSFIQIHKEKNKFDLFHTKTLVKRLIKLNGNVRVGKETRLMLLLFNKYSFPIYFL